MKKVLQHVNVIIIGLLVTGCVAYTPLPPKVFLHPYDPVLTKTLNDKVGNGSIQGSAFLRQGGGGVVTCAGSEVVLVPKTPYATEYLTDRYASYILDGSFDSNGKGYIASNNYVASPKGGNKTTTCDAQGNFIFNKISDGEYYVVTNVYWEVLGKGQGGNLSRYVKILGGGETKVVLSK